MRPEEELHQKDLLLLAGFAVGSGKALEPEKTDYAAPGRMRSASRAGLTTYCHLERLAVVEGPEPSQKGLPVHAEQHQLAEGLLVVAACSEKVQLAASC